MYWCTAMEVCSFYFSFFFSTFANNLTALMAFTFFFAAFLSLCTESFTPIFLTCATRTLRGYFLAHLIASASYLIFLASCLSLFSTICFM